MDKVEIHKSICDNCNVVYEQKNHDYGDSFAVVRHKMPNAILVRLFDKVLRLETLLNGGEQKVADENIDDTLTDLANYALMELVERQVDKEEAENIKNCSNCKYRRDDYFGSPRIFCSFGGEMQETKPNEYCKCWEPKQDKPEMEKSVTSKYDGLSNEKIRRRLCSKINHEKKGDCRKCPIGQKYASNGCESCTDYVERHFGTARAMMIEFLEKEGKE